MHYVPPSKATSRNPHALLRLAQSPTQSIWPALCLACLLLVLVGGAYQDARFNGFHFDDEEHILNNPAIWIKELDFQGLAHAWRSTLFTRRPLPFVTFALDWWRGDGAPQPFQITNLWIHTLNTIVVYLLLLIVVQRLKGKLTYASLSCAFLGAAVWAVHPIQVQAVTYIVQRMAEMAALFTLLSLLSYLYGRLYARNPLPWFVLCGVSFACGAVSKENAWVLPMLIVLAEYGVVRHGQALYRRPGDFVFLALPVAALAYLVLDLTFGGSFSQLVDQTYERWGRDFTLEQRLLTQPRVIFFHLSQVMWPLPQRFSLEHDFPVSLGLLHPPSTLAALSGTMIWGGAGLTAFLLRRWRAVGFLILWLPASLAIESSVIPLEMVFEHRMYLPMFGIVGLLTSGLLLVLDRQGIAALCAFASMLAFLGVCFISTQLRMPVWRTDESLYRAITLHAPDNARPWSNLGAIYAVSGRADEALETLNRALAIEPDNLLALEFKGVALMNLGRYDEANRWYGRAAELGSDVHTLLNHRGRLALLRHRPAEAKLFFLAAIEKIQWIAAYHRNAALAHEQLGEYESALALWRTYLKLETDEGERHRVTEYVRQNYPEASTLRP